MGPASRGWWVAGRDGVSRNAGRRSRSGSPEWLAGLVAGLVAGGEAVDSLASHRVGRMGRERRRRAG